MKTNFSSLDLAAATCELQALIGMRLNQVFDVDHNTYLFKFHRQEEKVTLLIESSTRIHTTTFAWPKNNTPSGFTMKLRKHLKNKRLEQIQQLGTDRIVILQFGSGEAAYSVILELFNRGNIILADHELMILNLLRPHTEGDRFKFAVREKYPIDRAREDTGPLSSARLQELFSNGPRKEKIFKVLLPKLDIGPHLLDHALNCSGLSKNSTTGDMSSEKIESLAKALLDAEEILKNASKEPSKGYIIKKREIKANNEELLAFVEFHPHLFKQLENEIHEEFVSFNAAIDEYYSKLEGQKIELKALKLEKGAMQKLQKISEDQNQRVEELALKQEAERRKAELIMANSQIVDDCIKVMRTAIAAQMSWKTIEQLVKEAREKKEPLGNLIAELKLNMNHITLRLHDTYDDDNDLPPTLVDIDLDLSAHANAKAYYHNKKSAALKEKKTIESQEKALKAAQHKAREVLKNVQTITAISKARKTHWFEKFYWFISSENYLIIGGRDQQQNELIVKRYMGPGDLYVHADVQGASNVVIKNPSGKPVPPKTLNEAGTMAVCFSVGWEAKVLCSAWWVYHHQVSKTAPTGEYLQTGSFMIRGKKNYLLPAQLSLGFGFLFRIDESCVERHRDERQIKALNDDDNLFEENTEELEEELTGNGVQDSPLGQSSSKLSDEENEDHPLIQEGVSNSSVEELDNETNEETPEVIRDDDSIEIKENNSDEESIKSEEVTPAEKKDEEPEPSGIVETASDNGNRKNKKNKNVSNKKPVESKSPDLSPQSGKPQALKRGQKSRLKKMMEKYKDQDEEEKRLRMSILQSAGEKKEGQSSKKNAKSKGKSDVKPKIEKRPPKTSAPDQEGDDMEPDIVVNTDVSILDFLTGQPHSDDELLYALPVVAPYSTVLSYKYKVKVLPGQSKRGKAAKVAVESFLRAKECVGTEKDLMKSVEYQVLARNFPGKVKIVAPVIKKKKNS